MGVASGERGTDDVGLVVSPVAPVAVQRTPNPRTPSCVEYCNGVCNQAKW